MMHSLLLPSILTLSITFSWYSFYAGWNYRHLRGDQQQRRARGRSGHAVPVYMWDIYNNGVNSSEVDVVKGIHPQTSGFSFKSRIYRTHCGRQLEFSIPKPQKDEVLVKAEVRITINKIRNRETYFQIYLKAGKWIFLSEKKVSGVDVSWLSLHVRPIKEIKPGVVKFLILTLFRGLEKNCREHNFSHPVLLLSYSSKRDSNENNARRKRSLQLEGYEEETNRIWEDKIFPDGVPKIPSRVRSLCRRKSLYIEFSEIDYDSWIVAPSGYEAYQCVGKCTFPLGEHLSPTKHAILQTLMHNMYPSKASRTCCVPTRLDPISILYVDENGVLTYRFRYRDMVVAECGCR